MTIFICYIKGQCNGNPSFIGYPNKYLPYLFTFRREILRVIDIQVTIIQYLGKGFDVKNSLFAHPERIANKTCFLGNVFKKLTLI